jgi:hypothetical protein
VEKNREVSKPREFVYFFAAQCLNFALVTWNIRSLALGWWGSMVISDVLISVLGFTLIKKIAEAKSTTAMIGYAVGGACGSLLAVFVTKKAFGQ